MTTKLLTVEVGILYLAYFLAAADALIWFLQ